MSVQQIADIVGCGFDKEDRLRFEIKFVNSWVGQTFLEKMIPEGSPLRLRMHMIKEEFLKKNHQEKRGNHELKIKEEPLDHHDQQRQQQQHDILCDKVHNEMDFETEDTTLFMCNICYTTFPTHPLLEEHQFQCRTNATESEKQQQSIEYSSKQNRTEASSNDNNSSESGKTHRNPLSSIVSKLHKAQTADGESISGRDTTLNEDVNLHPATLNQSPVPSATYNVDSKLNIMGTVHECENCHMTFADAEYLQRHKVRCKNHADSAIKCEICGRGFTAKGSLELHIDAVHLKKKEFVCSICGKAFSRKHILKIHLDTHYGRKDFQCAVCGKRFLQKSNLSRHERIHESKNFGYGCRFCGQAFTQNKHLKNHMLALHPEQIEIKGNTV